MLNSSSSKNLLFKFTSNETLTNTTLSIGPSVFFAIGDIRNTGNRNERNFVISCYNSTTDYASNYPDGTKTNIDENNLVTRTKHDNIFYLSISLLKKYLKNQLMTSSKRH